MIIETRIETIRVIAIKSINDTYYGERSAEYTNPSHKTVEGTKVFVRGAVDFLCSLLDETKIDSIPMPYDIVIEHIAHNIAAKVVEMIWIAAGINKH